MSEETYRGETEHPASRSTIPDNVLICAAGRRIPLTEMPTCRTSLRKTTSLRRRSSIGGACHLLTSPGTVDPLSMLYSSTMLTMAGLLVVAFVANGLVRPVDPKHHWVETAK